MNRCPVQDKRQFTSSQTAWEFVWHFELDKRPTEPTRNWHVYKCKNCKTWHLTSQERWRIHPNTARIQAVKDSKKPKPRKYYHTGVMKRKPVEEIMAHAYRLMREHLGLQAPKHTTLKGQLPLTEQRRLLQELTQKQSTGAL